MMLIDADALEKDGWYLCRTVQVDKNMMEYQTKKPTAFKVLEVVRCKNCKHWYSDADTGMACEFTNMGQPKDGFCNWAEMRSNETD